MQVMELELGSEQGRRIAEMSEAFLFGPKRQVDGNSACHNDPVSQLHVPAFKIF
jgi:hypothetical protein